MQVPILTHILQRAEAALDNIKQAVLILYQQELHIQLLLEVEALVVTGLTQSLGLLLHLVAAKGKMDTVTLQEQ